MIWYLVEAVCLQTLYQMVQYHLFHHHNNHQLDYVMHLGKENQVNLV